MGTWAKDEDDFNAKDLSGRNKKVQVKPSSAKKAA